MSFLAPIRDEVTRQIITPKSGDTGSFREKQDLHICSRITGAIQGSEHLKDNFDELLNAEWELPWMWEILGDLNLRESSPIYELLQEIPPGSHGEHSVIARSGSNYCEICWVMQHKKDSTTIANFKDEGRMPWAKECRKLLEAGKDKEMNYSLEPSEGNAALPKPWF